jgi:hydrogenase-4 component B
MLAPMLALAAACILIGLLPLLVLAPARLIATGVAHLSDIAGVPPSGWTDGAARITALGLGLVGLSGAGLLLRRRIASGARRLATTWGCGAAALSPRAQYTASSFAAPLLAAFGPVAGLREHREPGVFHSHPMDPVQDAAVLPAWRALGRASTRLREMQGGRLRWYLASVILTLLALLSYMAITRRTP